MQEWGIPCALAATEAVVALRVRPAMFTLRLLGGFSLLGPTGELLQALAQRRAEAVLGVLALAGELGCTRSRLAGLLWPESDETHARHNLSNALHVLRLRLGPDAVAAAGETLRLNAACVDVDVRRFEQALGAGHEEEAVRVYGGPLLAGFYLDGAPEFDRWLEEERARLFRACAEAIETLATRAEAQGDWRAASVRWQRAVEHDPHNSRIVVRLMRSLAAAGDRGNALLAAEAHVRRLRDDLELAPDELFEDEVARLRRAHSADDAARRPAPAGASQSSAAAGAVAQPMAVATVAAPDGMPGPVAPAWARVRRNAPLFVAGVALFVSGGALFVRRAGTGADGLNAPVDPRPSVAVLPCESSPQDERHRLVATALHDELLTQLAKVANLRPISRISVLEYAGSARPAVSQIARELGVGNVVECSVRMLRDSVLVQVQLTDASGAPRVWSNWYDLARADAFAVGSEMARQIVAAVGVELSADARRMLAAGPTSNAEAYERYLAGHEFWTRPGRERRNLEAAQRLFEQALALDPSFALAHATLSELHGRMYSDRYDPSPARAASQEREAMAALRLAPDLPEAHVAMGLVHYWGRREYRAALAEFDRARPSLPNDALLKLYEGYVHRRLGDWDNVIRLVDEGRSLDPRNADLFYDLGGHSYHMMHRYADAVRMFDRTLVLTAGTHASAAVHKGLTYATWTGQLDSLRAAVRRFPPDAPVGPHGDVMAFTLQLGLWERRGNDILTALGRWPAQVLLGSEFIWPTNLYAGWAHELRGDRAAARAAFASARVVVDSIARALPGDWRVHAARGLVLANLGEVADARAEATWLALSPVYRTDAFWGSILAERRSQILAKIGDVDAALADAERMLAVPSWQSAWILRLDPRWDPIRADARFAALLQRYAVR